MKITVDETQYRSKHFYVRSHYALPGDPAYSEKLFHWEMAFPKFQEMPMHLYDEASVECDRISDGLIPGAVLRLCRDSVDLSKGTFHIVINFNCLQS